MTKEPDSQESGSFLRGLLLQETEQAVLVVGLARHRDEVVAGLTDDLAQLHLVDGLFADDIGLALGMGGGDLLHGKGIADGVVDVRFTHPAHHTVDPDFRFIHGKLLLSCGTGDAGG